MKFRWIIGFFAGLAAFSASSASMADSLAPQCKSEPVKRDGSVYGSETISSLSFNKAFLKAADAAESVGWMVDHTDKDLGRLHAKKDVQKPALAFLLSSGKEYETLQMNIKVAPAEGGGSRIDVTTDTMTISKHFDPIKDVCGFYAYMEAH